MLIYITVIIIVIIFDQVTKFLTTLFLKPLGSVPIVQNVLHLTYSENTGAAFSMLRDRQLLLIVISGLAMVGFVVYLFKWSQRPGQHWQKLCFAFIIGGGIANLIDRIRLSYVVDMIDFRLINFAIFNIADSFITVGAIGLLALILLNVD
ncbi:MAG: signal peptidase II [Clostridiales bacterium]|nr:MAG: signal peptidase II [Clostridiales bacterium]